MTNNKLKSIAEELKDNVEREYAEELMSGITMNIEALIESHIVDYEDENGIELTGNEEVELAERIEQMIDIESIEENIAEAKYIQKNGMLSYLGMNERDFL